MTVAKREAILFLFGCSEVNSTWLITSELANQRARKVLFTCVVLYILIRDGRDFKYNVFGTFLDLTGLWITSESIVQSLFFSFFTIIFIGESISTKL